MRHSERWAVEIGRERERPLGYLAIPIRAWVVHLLASSSGMEFRILGPLEVLEDGRPVALGGGKPRALLAVLLLHPNEALTTDRLIEDLWGERAPPTAAKAVYVHVSRLRKALAAGAGNGGAGEGLLVTRERGYELRLDPKRLDSQRFERLVAEGRSELADGRPERALETLERALSLWRGEPLADLAYEPFAQAEIARLNDLRVGALEQLVEAKLALGRHGEVIVQLETQIGEHPYRERLRGQLMLALYRSDRQADALQAYQDARTALVEELGIEPGERLRELERAILAQDPTLAAARPAAVEPPGESETRDGESLAPAPEGLPTGVVTFLLTDIEGSSRLWELNADAMAAALELHDELVEESVNAHEGWLLKAKGEGDATLSVFRRASDAVACAVECQRALLGNTWPGGLHLRVRIGLHTGEAHEREGDYFGPALNRAARLRAIACGGAILMSQATAEIVQDRLPDDVELVDLGRQGLRGLSRPENVFELRERSQPVLAGESTLDAPVSAAGGVPKAPRTRLPVPPTRTVGRERERSAVAELLRREEVRLATLTGAGGVGKTRLALEVARDLERQLADGSWFVSLAATAQAADVASTIAQTIAAPQQRGESSEAAVERYLASRRGLLVLDNFEHVLSAAPLISGLLDRCPATKVLATSRERLRLRAEHRYEVSPLPTPTETRLAAVEQSPAGALFVECARSHDHAFELTDENAGAIAHVCRRLDGLPLALELAAARTALLGVEELNARLAETLEVLGSGARDLPDRQQTLRATIEWSYRLLGPAQADAFANFAVFAGGATIEAAEAVTGASLDTLSGLVDKHLLLRRPGVGETSRLLMLETVREYAAERLEAGRQATEVHARHVRHYLALAERAEPHLWSHAEAQWLPHLDAEIDNLRAAFDWSVQHSPVDALRLVGALGPYWNFRSQFAEGASRAEAALDAGHDAPVSYRARARLEQAVLVANVHRNKGRTLQVTREYAEEALELFREVGDREGAGFALMGLAWCEEGEPLPQRRRFELAEKAVACAHETGNDRLLALSLTERALAMRPEHAGPDIEQAAEGLRELGDFSTLLELYWNAAHNAIKAGSPELAGSWIDRATPLAREMDDPLEDMLLSGTVGLHALFSDELDRAETAFAEQLGHGQELALHERMSQGFAGLAAIAVQQGDDERAARLVGAATAIGHIDDPDVVAQLDTRFFSPARARHGTPAWDHARAVGAEMTLEQALTLALGPEPRSD